MSRGFKLHMGGQWTFSADIEGPGGTDRAIFVVDVQATP